MLCWWEVLGGVGALRWRKTSRCTNSQRAPPKSMRSREEDQEMMWGRHRGGRGLTGGRGVCRLQVGVEGPLNSSVFPYPPLPHRLFVAVVG